VKLKGDALKLAILISLMVAFVIYANIYKDKQDSKFNQFIDSYEGKTTVIRYLFYLEGVDKTTIDKCMNQKKMPLSNRNLDSEHRVEKVIQYALKELNLNDNDQKALIQLLEPPKEYNISDAFFDVGPFLNCQHQNR